MFADFKHFFLFIFLGISVSFCSSFIMATDSIASNLSKESVVPNETEDLFDLSFVTDYTMSHPTVQKVFLPFIEQSTRDTDGKITFKYYQTNTLFPDDESYAAFEKGKVDFGVVRPGLFDKKMPLSTVIDIPFMAPNAIVGSLLAQDITKKFIEVREEFPKNSEVFALWSSASYQLHSVLPIQDLSQIKGKKIAIWQNSLIDTVEKLGASPVLLNTTDTTAALEQGVVDAVLSPFVALNSYNTIHIAKYHLLLNLGVSSFALSCREPIWDQFSPEIQRYFKSVCGAHFSYQIAKTLEEWEEEDIEKMQKEGHTFYALKKSDQQKLDQLFISSQQAWLDAMPEGKKAIAKEVLEYALERVAFYKSEYGAK